MAESVIKQSIPTIRSCTFGQITLDAATSIDLDTGMAPLGSKWCVINGAVGFFYLGGYWYDNNTQTIHITMINPTNKAQTSTQWANVNIIDFD